jgi:hypothetical protein
MPTKIAGAAGADFSAAWLVIWISPQIKPKKISLLFKTAKNVQQSPSQPSSFAYGCGIQSKSNPLNPPRAASAKGN